MTEMHAHSNVINIWCQKWDIIEVQCIFNEIYSSWFTFGVSSGMHIMHIQGTFCCAEIIKEKGKWQSWT